MAAEHLQFVVAVGIADGDPHQKAVQLALRQRIGAFELERVLRGDDHERLRQYVRLAVDGHLAVAHRLEQRALRARRRAIDLVGQHDVAEDRTARVDELAGLRVVDVAAGDVAGQQVGRELDARERGRDALGQRLADQRLAHAGHVLQQDVIGGQQRHDAQPHDVRSCRARPGRCWIPARRRGFAVRSSWRHPSSSGAPAATDERSKPRLYVPKVPAPARDLHPSPASRRWSSPEYPAIAANRPAAATGRPIPARKSDS